MADIVRASKSYGAEFRWKHAVKMNLDGMYQYQVYFKCRACGETFPSKFEENSVYSYFPEEAMKTMNGFWLETVHVCADGEFGRSDVVKVNRVVAEKSWTE